MHVSSAAARANTPAVNAALFPHPAARQAMEQTLGHWLEASRSQVVTGSVTPTLDDRMFTDALAQLDFAEPVALDDLLQWTIESMQQGHVQMTHPCYFGLFNPAPTFPAECADRIVAAFNPQLATFTTSPVPIRIEQHVIDAVARRAGLPADTQGHFTTGGSEANFSALICALTKAHPRFAEDGVRAFAGQPVFYISVEAHLAWCKIAQEAGIGRSSVRQVDTDGAGRMDVDALSVLIAGDLASGRIPVMVVATAGTTGGGMVDPLVACAGIARQAGAWFHVDAAWGGALIASPSRRHVLAGIEQADSVTIDAHKWFATTMACGMFLTTVPNILPAAFHVSNTFMPPTGSVADPYLTSMSWSRRFVGLRLFLSLGAAGWGGYEEHVEHAVRLVDLLRRSLIAEGWDVANESPMAVLCVAPPAGSATPQTIVRRVLGTGRAWISTASFEGRQLIRICLTNGRTTAEDVAELLRLLLAARAPT